MYLIMGACVELCRKIYGKCGAYLLVTQMHTRDIIHSVFICVCQFYLILVCRTTPYRIYSCLTSITQDNGWGLLTYSSTGFVNTPAVWFSSLRNILMEMHSGPLIWPTDDWKLWATLITFNTKLGPWWHHMISRTLVNTIILHPLCID